MDTKEALHRPTETEHRQDICPVFCLQLILHRDPRLTGQRWDGSLSWLHASASPFAQLYTRFPLSGKRWQKVWNPTNIICVCHILYNFTFRVTFYQFFFFFLRFTLTKIFLTAQFLKYLQPHFCLSPEERLVSDKEQVWWFFQTEPSFSEHWVKNQKGSWSV